MNRLAIVVGALVLNGGLLGCASQRAAVQRAPVPRPTVGVVGSAEKGSPEEQEALAVILRQSVLRFEFDSADLNEPNRERLQAVADALMARPWATIRILGHCDERGTAEYNLALGHRRAEAAKRYLVALGVHPDAVETLSYGAELPAQDGHDEEAWAVNRRDELQPVDRELLGQAEPLTLQR